MATKQPEYRITPEAIKKAQQHRPWSVLANAFPLMAPGEFENLCRSIKKNGLRQPCDTFNGEVIEGRNRQIACIVVGHPPRYEETEFPDIEAAAEYVWDLNENRRHMTPSQRALAAAEMKKILDGRNTTKQASEITGAPERSIRRAGVVLEKGAPELVRAVQSGEVDLVDAERIVDLPKNEQKKRVQAVQAGRSAKVSVAPQDEGGSDEAAWLETAQRPYKEALRRIDAILKDFEAVTGDAVMSKHLPWARLKVQLDSSRAMFEKSTPHAVCCGSAHRKDCVCQGAGFVTQHQWDSPETRNKVDAAKKKR